MRTIQCVRAGWLVGALGACILIAGAARADVATERPGSILIFPKVVRDGTRDTVIQISNTGNLTDHVRCFYVNGAPGPNGQPLWTVIDFFMWLTKQQPTHWSVSAGRRIDPSDPFGTPGAGLDPGLIPAVPQTFTGALVCVEVGTDGLPVGMNKLKGEATITGPSALVSKYNALAVAGIAVARDNRLLLDNLEYNGCPAASVLNFVADGASDPVIEALGNGGTCTDPPGAPCNSNADCNPTLPGICITGQSGVLTNLTVLPCNMDFQTGVPRRVSLNFAVRDEFENPFSGSLDISCWSSFDIGTVPAMRAVAAGGALATQYATVRITSTSGGPVVAVAESFHVDSVGNSGSAAVNLIMEGTDPTAQIRLTDE
jgi:hypothetical protein